MSDKILISNQSDGSLEVIFNTLDGWVGFEQLLNFLINVLSAKHIETIEGDHDIKICRLTYKGVEFKVCYDTLFGNYIIAESEQSKKVVEDILPYLYSWL